MPKGEEKRKTVRILIEVPFKFSSLDYPTENADGKMVDLSVSGVSVETDREILLGENLEIKISLPNGFNCTFNAQVAREMGNKKYGLNITKINMLDRIKLGDFIMTQLNEQTSIIKKMLKGNK
jgi:hypothetical protein